MKCPFCHKDMNQSISDNSHWICANKNCPNYARSREESKKIIHRNEEELEEWDSEISVSY